MGSVFRLPKSRGWKWPQTSIYYSTKLLSLLLKGSIFYIQKVHVPISTWIFHVKLDLSLSLIECPDNTQLSKVHNSVYGKPCRTKMNLSGAPTLGVDLAPSFIASVKTRGSTCSSIYRLSEADKPSNLGWLVLLPFQNSFARVELSVGNLSVSNKTLEWMLCAYSWPLR